MDYCRTICRTQAWLFIATVLLLVCGGKALAQDESDNPFGPNNQPPPPADAAELRTRAIAALEKATEFYRSKLAVNGGYVYYTSVDGKKRWGDGPATSTQICVQHPGTLAVAFAFMRAHSATGDERYREAAVEAAEAIVYGQLKSGGWTNTIDFDPRGDVAQYRNGKGGGKNNVSEAGKLTLEPLYFLMLLDQHLDFKNEKIHKSVETALDALLAAQFSNGAFPGQWEGLVYSDADKHPSIKAGIPDDWRTANRTRTKSEIYSLEFALNLTNTLRTAHKIYRHAKYQEAASKLGDFLILAQLPDPQPGWAQHYDFEMKPVWAGKSEPPAVSSEVTQNAISTLMEIAIFTQDKKYLEPIPAALAYLEKCEDAKTRTLARFYELKTNKPLYPVPDGEDYKFTNDASKLPELGDYQVESEFDELKSNYRSVELSFQYPLYGRGLSGDLQGYVEYLTDTQDEQGRWVSTYKGEELVGNPKFAEGDQYLSNKVFCDAVEALSLYIRTTPKQAEQEKKE